MSADAGLNFTLPRPGIRCNPTLHHPHSMQVRHNYLHSFARFVSSLRLLMACAGCKERHKGAEFPHQQQGSHTPHINHKRA
eukprot:1159948-Pelagomonas_calceolata.AAC.13